MFYSHEVLTSRKYGVATVWLVATLGSKSTLKKVSRKAILDVDVQKACETIVTPAAPMALRLQSNLLYGVTRVYSQQCGYVLNDAEQARNNMRMLFKIMQTSSLNEEGENKGRAEQLILQDDPNYLPDFDLMPLDLDRLDIDMTTTEDSQRSTLSPQNSQRIGIDISSQHDIGGLIIPPSASPSLAGPFGGSGGFSVRGDSGAGARVDIGGLDDDLGLAIDEDGYLHVDDEPIRQPGLPFGRGERTDFGSASSRVRRQNEGRLEPDIFGPPDDDGFLPIQDDLIPAQEADALLPGVEEPVQQQQTTSEETAEAPVRRRPRAAPKIIVLDGTKELRNADLARWNTDYVANQHEAIRQKNAHQATALAKKNAEYWILGQDDQGPLSLFQGAKLFEALTGINLREAGKKRPRDEGYVTDEGRHVRARSQLISDEIGHGFQDEGYMPLVGDDTIEQGREAPTPLDDRHISNIMPWNQSTGSRRPTGVFSAGGAPTSASFGGKGRGFDSLPRRPSRLASASPLMGRGTVGGEMDGLQFPGSQGGDIEMTGLDDFEIFGPAAQVDTQTAENSQWQRAALDGESMHFLEFVQTAIEEMDQARDQTATNDEEDKELKGSIDLHSLLPPENHSRIVAAQALLHVLALGTKNLLALEQQESFGAITMRVL